MKQCFYIIAYYLHDDSDLNLQKIFLQEDQAVKYGRKFATKYRNTNVNLYKQLIATTATVEFVKALKPY